MNIQQGNVGETHQQADNNSTNLTTQQGIVLQIIRIAKGRSPGSCIAGRFIYVRKITHFDHERIPERVVHARGSAAHGYFELTKSLEQFTTAKGINRGGNKPHYSPVFNGSRVGGIN